MLVSTMETSFLDYREKLLLIEMLEEIAANILILLVVSIMAIIAFVVCGWMFSYKRRR